MSGLIFPPKSGWHALWLLLCLPFASSGDADLDAAALVQGVRIHTPASTPLPRISSPSSTSATILPDPQQMSGAVLLHRYGCASCHDLYIPHFIQQRGPLLDAIAHKVSPDWLNSWLENPFAYLPASKMPRVELTLQERDALVAFLCSLAPDRLLSARPALEPDPYNGGELFVALACQQCHRVGGEGGPAGPALDRLGLKTSRHWLYAFLKAPDIAQPGTRSHTFHLVDREALDLGEFLARRFAAGRRLSDRFTPISVDTTRAQRGLQTAIERGCFQCHAITSLRGLRLPLPASPSTATAWLDHHRQAGKLIPPISVSPAAGQAMRAALQTPRDAADKLVEPRPLPADYWQLPVPLQGSAPSAYSAETRDLTPAACATCHPRQAEAWANSRHARSLSPGLLAQLVDAPKPELIRHCLSCHAPLAEQSRDLVEADEFIPGHGITCAGCHVRAHRRFGPPPQAFPPVAAHFTGGQHGGAIHSPDFHQSPFCAPCHQFDPAGLALNGKLLQNTHAEWAASPQRARGETCQTCHMPGGDHRMPGIHDPLTVSRALELDIDWDLSPDQRQLRATVRLHNRGAGHHLPTYTTPALFVKVALGDDTGVIDSSLQTRVVQRRIQLGARRELFDTRIPAGGIWEFSFERSVPAQARLLTVIVEVDPDHFYRSFFERLAGSEPFGVSRGPSAELVRQAHAQVLASPYILFVRTIELQ